MDLPNDYLHALNCEFGRNQLFLSPDMAWKEAVEGGCTLEAGWMQPPCFQSQVKYMHASGPAWFAGSLKIPPVLGNHCEPHMRVAVAWLVSGGMYLDDFVALRTEMS